MQTYIARVRALIARDFREELSYRFNIVLELVSACFLVLVFYYIGKAAAVGGASAYTNGYFAFVLPGLAFSGFMNICMGSLTSLVKEGLTSGTLETIAATPAGLATAFTARAVWGFIRGATRLAVICVAGYAIAGPAVFTAFDPFATAAAISLGFISFAATGMISASVLVVYKKGDPINILMNFLTLLLGGVFFPPSLLPAWAAGLSQLLPMTYALEITRAGMDGAPPASWTGALLRFSILTAVLAATGFGCLRRAVARAMKDGALAHY